MSFPARFPISQRILHCEQFESRELLAGVNLTESFEQIAVGDSPANFVQWSSSSSGQGSFAVATPGASGSARGLATSGASTLTGRFWYPEQLDADTSISSTIRADSLIPAQIFARGSNLESASPTFYSVTLTRGVEVTLSRVVDGTATKLASLTSARWLSGEWLRVTLSPQGQTLAVQVERTATGEYLNSAGVWQADPADAIRLSDGAITGDGLVGLNRQARYAGAVLFDDLTIREPTTSTGVATLEGFETTAVGALPSGWDSWLTAGAGGIAVGDAVPFGGQRGLTSTGGSASANRAWVGQAQPADLEISAALRLETLIPAKILLRGADLSTAAPTYYAASLVRGGTLQIERVVGGTVEVLGSVKTASYFSGEWVQLSFEAEGDDLRASVQRVGTGEWLDPTGRWVSGKSVALGVSDNAIRGGGLVGLGRAARYAGSVHFDDFRITPRGAAPGTGNPPVEDTQPPTVMLLEPAGPGPFSGVIDIRASVEDDVAVVRVEFWLDGLPVTHRTEGPFVWHFNSEAVADGDHRIEIRAYDAAGNLGVAERTLVIANSPTTSRPDVPAHYTHVRVAQLAYSSTPVSNPFEQQLLRDSVDLVIPNTAHLATIHAASPDTPQFIYSNVSNIYLELLTDYLAFADARGADREAAFYHVAQATPFQGASPSSIPVRWFWAAWNGGTAPEDWSRGFTDVLSRARATVSGGVTLPGAGGATYLGYPEQFHEIDWALSRAAGAGWSGRLEYVSAVDAHGYPTAWKPLTPTTDATNGWKTSGKTRFDPPADWVAASINGSDRLFYVRAASLSGTTDNSPVAARILGRDYVNAGGKNSGVIPAFDFNADKDGDGFLNDAEYAARAPGKDARFVYESRLFYPFYGQQRFVTNPSSVTFREWVGDFHRRFLDAFPLADGVFIDNSNGRLPTGGAAVVEDTSNYTLDYAAALRTLETAIAPRWSIANTAGGNSQTDHVIAATTGSLDEFALRPLSSPWSWFHDVADRVASRRAVNPDAYMILDSLPTNGSPTDPRTQMATLAYYYLVGDPDSTFLMLYGGFEPSTTWQRHWFDAVAFDVGRPLGTWNEWATGIDPATVGGSGPNDLIYKVFSRRYSNALVLYKPLSYRLGGGTGTLADSTRTTHQLDGNYRVLNADGSLGSVVNSINLRNGEGAVLIPA